MNRFIILILLGILSACTGLDIKSTQLDIGSAKKDVLNALGNPLDQSTQGGVLAWQYGAKIGLGYCDYRDVYFLHDKVIQIDHYYHSSLGGCLFGLRQIDWGPMLAQAKTLDEANSQTSNQTKQP